MMIVKMSQGWNRVRAATHAWTVTAAPMLYGILVTIAGFVIIGLRRTFGFDRFGGYSDAQHTDSHSASQRQYC